jgi:hypothetical protein
MQLRRKTNIASMKSNRPITTTITITITTFATTITTITTTIATIAIGRIDRSARLLGSRAMRARLYRMKWALQILPGSAIGSRNG